MIYTVGHAETYDAELAHPDAPQNFKKVGKNKNYSGGYAFRTPADAARLLQEQGREDWGVYEVEATWDKHTEPVTDGWWHCLTRTSRIIRRVPTPVLEPTYPPAWKMSVGAPTVDIEIVVPAADSLAAANWVYERGGRVLSSGYLPVDYNKVDTEKMHIRGYIPTSSYVLLSDAAHLNVRHER